uniref:YidB family protein n=1 Tax=Falsiroseomonas oryziterrae TaxID=2911368 RepID=UPI001F48546F
LGGGQGGGAMGGGLGGLLGGLLGGMAGGQGGMARGGGMPGGLAGGMGGMKGVVLMALLAYLMRGQGGRAGLASITDQFRAAGLGDRAESWVGPGANRDISPQEVARVLPPGALDDIERQTGLGRDEVLSELSRGLPRMVDRLTPRGRLPDSDDELNEVDEAEVLGSFGLAPGAAYGKTRPGDGGMKG